MVNETPKWLKRLRKRKRREADAAISIMQWQLEEQKRQIDEQYRTSTGNLGEARGMPGRWWV